MFNYIISLLYVVFIGICVHSLYISQLAIGELNTYCKTYNDMSYIFTIYNCTFPHTPKTLISAMNYVLGYNIIILTGFACLILYVLDNISINHKKFIILLSISNIFTSSNNIAKAIQILRSLHELSLISYNIDIILWSLSIASLITIILLSLYIIYNII